MKNMNHAVRNTLIISSVLAFGTLYASAKTVTEYCTVRETPHYAFNDSKDNDTYQPLLSQHMDGRLHLVSDDLDPVVQDWYLTTDELGLDGNADDYIMGMIRLTYDTDSKTVTDAVSLMQTASASHADYSSYSVEKNAKNKSVYFYGSDFSYPKMDGGMTVAGKQLWFCGAPYSFLTPSYTGLVSEEELYEARNADDTKIIDLLCLDPDKGLYSYYINTSSDVDFREFDANDNLRVFFSQVRTDGIYRMEIYDPDGDGRYEYMWYKPATFGQIVMDAADRFSDHPEYRNNAPVIVSADASSTPGKMPVIYTGGAFLTGQTVKDGDFAAAWVSADANMIEVFGKAHKESGTIEAVSTISENAYFVLNGQTYVSYAMHLYVNGYYLGEYSIRSTPSLSASSWRIDYLSTLIRPEALGKRCDIWVYDHAGKHNCVFYRMHPDHMETYGGEKLLIPLEAETVLQYDSKSRKYRQYLMCAVDGKVMSVPVNVDGLYPAPEKTIDGTYLFDVCVIEDNCHTYYAYLDNLCTYTVDKDGTYTIFSLFHGQNKDGSAAHLPLTFEADEFCDKKNVHYAANDLEGDAPVRLDRYTDSRYRILDEMDYSMVGTYGISAAHSHWFDEVYLTDDTQIIIRKTTYDDDDLQYEFLTYRGTGFPGSTDSYLKNVRYIITNREDSTSKANLVLLYGELEAGEELEFDSLCVETMEVTADEDGIVMAFEDDRAYSRRSILDWLNKPFFHWDGSYTDWGEPIWTGSVHFVPPTGFTAELYVVSPHGETLVTKADAAEFASYLPLTLDRVTLYSSGKISAAVSSFGGTADSIAFTEDSLAMHVGMTKALPVQTVPSVAVRSAVTYTSSDPSVVMADADGFVTALSVGTADITADAGNGLTAVIRVTVGSEERVLQHKVAVILPDENGRWLKEDAADPSIKYVYADADGVTDWYRVETDGALTDVFPTVCEENAYAYVGIPAEYTVGADGALKLIPFMNAYDSDWNSLDFSYDLAAVTEEEENGAAQAMGTSETLRISRRADGTVVLSSDSAFDGMYAHALYAAADRNTRIVLSSGGMTVSYTADMLPDTAVSVSDAVFVVGADTDHAEAVKLLYLYGTADENVLVGAAFEHKHMIVGAGAQRTLSLRAVPAGEPLPAYTYSVSDPSVAAVRDGVVTGLSAGSAEITAVGADGRTMASCTVYVLDRTECLLTMAVPDAGGTWLRYDADAAYASLMIGGRAAWVPVYTDGRDTDVYPAPGDADIYVGQPLYCFADENGVYTLIPAVGGQNGDGESYALPTDPGAVLEERVDSTFAAYGRCDGAVLTKYFGKRYDLDTFADVYHVTLTGNTLIVIENTDRYGKTEYYAFDADTVYDGFDGTLSDVRFILAADTEHTDRADLLFLYAKGNDIAPNTGAAAKNERIVKGMEPILSDGQYAYRYTLIDPYTGTEETAFGTKTSVSPFASPLDYGRIVYLTPNGRVDDGISQAGAVITSAARYRVIEFVDDTDIMMIADDEDNCYYIDMSGAALTVVGSIRRGLGSDLIRWEPVALSELKKPTKKLYSACTNYFASNSENAVQQTIYAMYPEIYLELDWVDENDHAARDKQTGVNGSARFGVVLVYNISSGNAEKYCDPHFVPEEDSPAEKVSVCITSARLCGASGNTLDAIPDGAFSAEAQLVCTGELESAVVLFESLDADGRMLTVRFVKITAEDGQTLTLGTSFPNEDGRAASVRIFVFDALDTCVPLAGSVTV